MKPIILKPFIVMLLCSALLFALVPEARADDSPYREQLTQTALREALGGRAVPLLDVVPPPGGRDGQYSLLMEMLSGSQDRRIHVNNPGQMVTTNRATTVFAADDSWYLDVLADGSRFRYRGNIDDRAEIDAVANFGPIDIDNLEILGREFIMTKLTSFVRLPLGETLAFQGTRYLREGDASDENQAMTSAVVANIAVFSREVLGTFVAGPGSKIAVWFSNSGEPVGFDVDWSEYAVPGPTQQTLPIDQVWSRFENYADHPIDRIQGNLQRFECGYVDLGAFKRGAAQIQAGCYAHHSGLLSGDDVYAAADVIPVGVAVLDDPNWPVTGFIARGQAWDICQAIPGACLEPPPFDICHESQAGEPGTPVTVPITLESGDGVAGMQFDLSYDSTILTPVAVNLGADTAAAGGWTSSFSILAPGSLRVLAHSNPPAALTPGPKEMLLVDFDISATAPFGPTPLTESNCILSDATGEQIPCNLCPDPGEILVRPAATFGFGPIGALVGVDLFDPLPFDVKVEAFDGLGVLATAYNGTATMAIPTGVCLSRLDPSSQSFLAGVGGPATYRVPCCLDSILPATTTQLQIQATDASLAITGQSDPFLGVAKGDTDASGDVTVLDVLRAANLTLQQAVAEPPPTAFQKWAANMLGSDCLPDASINVLDVVRISNKALNRPPLCNCLGTNGGASPSLPVSGFAAETAAEPVGIRIVREGPRSHLVFVDGAVDLAGLQFELRGAGGSQKVTPAGLLEGKGWQVMTVPGERNRQRVLVFSMAATGVSGDGPVLRLEGKGRPRLVGTLASDSRGREISVD